MMWTWTWILFGVALSFGAEVAAQPSSTPTTQPSSLPTQPASQPTTQPTTQPATQPVNEPVRPSSQRVAVRAPSASPPQMPSGDLEDISLEELMGQAKAPSRYAEPVSRSPATISVVSREQIERSVAWSIPELLRFVPGVDVFMNTRDSYNVSLRGMNEVLSNNVVLLIDGHPLTNELDGQIDWSSLPIALAEIERIEVVRGPVSAVYGANAFTGVINVVRRDIPRSPAAWVRLGGGDRGSLSASGWYGDTAGKLGYSAAVQHQQSDAMLPEGADGSRSTLFNLRAQLEAYHGGVIAANLGSSMGRLNLISAQLPANASYLTQGLFQALTWTHRDVGLFSNDQLILTESYHHYRLKAVTDDPLAERLGQSRVQRIDAELAYRFSLSRWDEQRLAASFRHVDARAPTLADGEADLFYYAVAWQATLRPIDPLSLSASVRWDYNAFVLDSGRLSLRGAATYQPTRQHALRVTAGTAFRNPTFFEAIGDFRDPSSGLILLRGEGSRNLEVPKSTAVEVGYRGVVFDTLTVDLVAFWQRVTDPIFPDVARVPSSFANADDRYGLGGEAELRWAFSPRASIFAGYAYQRITDDDDERLLNNPQHKAHFGFGSTWPRNLTFDLALQVVSSHRFAALAGIPPALLLAEIDTRALLNARVAYTIAAWNLTFAVAVANVIGPTDRVESPYPTAVTFDRRIFGSVIWSR